MINNDIDNDTAFDTDFFIVDIDDYDDYNDHDHAFYNNEMAWTVMITSNLILISWMLYSII